MKKAVNYLFIFTLAILFAACPLKISFGSGWRIYWCMGDLPPILVPQVKLEFSHFIFLNSGAPLALEDGNSKNCVV
jgi:hypothetical protein